jgi:hypothetical protein
MRSAPDLRRFREAAPRRRAGEHCEMCDEALAEDHRHVVNLETRNLLCACTACHLLFTHEGAAGGRYRAIPDRYLYDASLELSERQWDELQIPVGMAFFFLNSSLGRFVAFYPSPAGATESLLPLETWQQVMEANPAFGSITPDVEALLLRRMDGRFECYLAPIDASYELVGRVRRHWKGFDGGEEVWTEIASFFSTLRERSRTVEANRG